MKSTLLNMTAVLFGITLIAAAGVGYVNLITEEPIALAKEAATKAALNEVLPAFDDTQITELKIDALPVKSYTATANGEVVGYAVESMTKEGFGGTIRMMVGFTPSGEIYNINVLEQSETPGLGTKMTEAENPLILSFQGKNPAAMTLAVRKDHGDVDALTAATISSRAYIDAVTRAWEAFKQVAQAETDEACTTVAIDDTETTGEAAAETVNDEPAAQEGGQNE